MLTTNVRRARRVAGCVPVPHGLPKALQGGNAPQNPWVFSSVITAAEQSCAS
jgi:hypothetical protein